MTEVICFLVLGFIAFIYGYMMGLTYPYPAWCTNYVFVGLMVMLGGGGVIIFELIRQVIKCIWG